MKTKPKLSPIERAAMRWYRVWTGDLERRLSKAEAEREAAIARAVQAERNEKTWGEKYVDVLAALEGVRKDVTNARNELAALVPDPSDPDFSLACANPADVQCLLQAYAILTALQEQQK